MAITCFIRYQIDPFQRDAFRHDAEGRANFDLAQAQRFILREERSWLEDVGATRQQPRQVAA